MAILSFAGRKMEWADIVQWIDGTVVSGTDSITIAVPAHNMIVLTDLDVSWYPNDAKPLIWETNVLRRVGSWTPAATTNPQSFHWSGLQCLYPGSSWRFTTTSTSGWDVKGWAYLCGSPAAF